MINLQNVALVEFVSSSNAPMNLHTQLIDGTPSEYLYFLKWLS